MTRGSVVDSVQDPPFRHGLETHVTSESHEHCGCCAHSTLDRELLHKRSASVVGALVGAVGALVGALVGLLVGFPVLLKT